MYTTFLALIEGYLHSLEGKSGWSKTVYVAKEWILTRSEMPTSRIIKERMHAICAGDFQPNATKANKELALIRAACNWGTYEELWTGGNPTKGIKKFRTPKRKRIGKLEELRTILRALDRVPDDACTSDKRDRALFGLMIVTGCRPCEARQALRTRIAPYGPNMGSWQKGTTKNGDPQDLPIPSQVMQWLAEVPICGPFYFSHTPGAPLDDSTVRKHWAQLRKRLQITGLWNYDLRRTLATYLQTELHQSDSTVQAILNHYDGRALAHYVHPPFDFLATVIQSYADWLWSLTIEHRPAPPILPPRIRHTPIRELTNAF